MTTLDREPTGWQTIDTHDNSRDPALVLTPKGPRVAWRNHPSSRTDTWLSLPGHWQITPTHWMPLPPAPDTVSTKEGK